MAAFAGLAACGKKEDKAPEAPAAPAGPPEGSLEWAVGGSWRSAADKARDASRHPIETLRFFGLQPKMTVVDFWPGSGWYIEILAPYLNKGGGTLYLAGFAEGPAADPAQVALNAALKARLEADKKLYGTVQFSAFGAGAGPVAPAGTADLVLFLRYIHAWMAAGLAEKAFADAFAALRPGGILGVEQAGVVVEELLDRAGVALQPVGQQTGRQTLAAPVVGQDAEAPRQEVADDLEILLDRFGAARAQHHRPARRLGHHG
jgi:predicted methyltransferase